MKQKILEILKKELSIAEDNLYRYSKAIHNKVWESGRYVDTTPEEIEKNYKDGFDAWYKKVSEIKNCIQWLEDLTDESKSSAAEIDRFVNGDKVYFTKRCCKYCGSTSDIVISVSTSDTICRRCYNGISI